MKKALSGAVWTRMGVLVLLLLISVQAMASGGIAPARETSIISPHERMQACRSDSEGRVSCSQQAAIGGGGGTASFLVVSSDRRSRLCGIEPDGLLMCAGDANLNPPAGQWRDVSTGGSYACGIQSDGRLQCWGDVDFTVPTAPTNERYLQVSAGADGACALRSDGIPQCWASEHSPKIGVVPAGRYIHLSVSEGFACALRSDGRLACWGEDRYGRAQPPQETGFVSFALGDRHGCALRESGRIACWGGGDVSPPDGTFVAIAAGTDFSCGVRPGGDSFCWGNRHETIGNISLSDIGSGRLANGSRHSCRRRADGGIACWGNNALGQRNGPAMFAAAIDSNADHSCALGVDHLLLCWGDNRWFGSQPPSIAMRDFDVGQHSGCGVAVEGDAVCWGWNANGQNDPPVGKFRSVATGLNHACGIRDDGTLACWGYGADGQTRAPTGEYVAVDIGERHSCAIAVDGVLKCWGLDSEGQASPPNLEGERFRALSTGAFHACALRNDGAVRCWGRNSDGQTDFPNEGRFVDIVAGRMSTCAVRENGAQNCWGRNDDGQHPSMAFVQTALPHAIIGSAYSSRLHVEGAAGYVPQSSDFRLVSGELPPGIQLHGDGALSGRPSAYGEFVFSVEATDANGIMANRAFRINVVDGSGDPGTLAADTDAADVTPPEVTPVYEGVLGDENWYRSDVVVRWSIVDPESPISQIIGCQGTTVTTDRGPMFEVVSNCEAISAGGSTGMRLATLRRDATPPSVAVTLSPQPNASGWNVSPVSITYSCSDWPSDIAICPAANSVSTVGITTIPAQTARDRAGNITIAPAQTIRIDNVPPTLTITEEGTPNADGWYRDLVVRFTCEDTLSGLASACPAPQTMLTSGFDVSAGAFIYDLAGNSASVSRRYKIDREAPSLQMPTINGPVLLNANVQVTPTASDQHSGIATVNCGPVDTSTAGTKVLSCTAVDRVGNATTKTVNYVVVYQFLPLSAPLDSLATTYTIASGRSLPFEWRLQDANGAAVTSATLGQVAVTTVACPATATVPLAVQNLVRQDTFENLGEGRYRRRWWIPYSDTVRCIRLDMSLDDGVTRSAIVRVVPKIMRTGGPQRPELSPAAPRSAPASQPARAQPRALPARRALQERARQRQR